MGSKKSHSYIARLLRHTPKKSYLKIIAYLGLNTVSCYLYTLSLEGGDIDYLLSQISYLASLIISSLLLSLLTIISNHYTCTGWVRVFNYILQFILLSLTLTRDMGTDLENHGQYNLLVYFLLLLPLILAYFIFKACSFGKSLVRSWKTCFLINVCIIVFSYFYIVHSIHAAEVNWYKGLGQSELIKEWESCSIEAPGLPWISMLPHRTLNFFTGSSSCGYRYEFSSLVNNTLKLNCPSEVTIIEQPDYISMRDNMFVLTETGFEVYNNTKALEKVYTVKGNAELEIKSEWLSVLCNGYENYYIQNVKKPEVYERLKTQSKKRTVKPMNIVLFMMDTVSRQQFYRKMGEMTEYLEYLNSTDKFETFQFFRIISNGFNTEYNTRAMYSGSQLRQNRRGRPYWDFFSGQGNVAAYINGFCEDWMSVFMRTTFKGMDHTVFYPWCHPEFHPYEKTFGNFAGPFSILRRCINGVHVHTYIFNYIRQLWKNYAPYGKIIHVSFQEGHEGTGEVLRTLSGSMTELFQELEESKELENTVVVLTSDHGSHMGPYFMASDMGKYEQKLPLLTMIFPKWFLDKYPDFRGNLTKNQQNLVAHYDTHWTLRHLATLPEFGGEILENRETEEWHEDVWDCVKYRKYMEIALMLEMRTWKKGMRIRFTDIVFTAIRRCFNSFNMEPQLHENITTVDVGQIKMNSHDEGYYVYEVIADINVFYWFEDAYQDVNKNYLLGNTEKSSFVDEVEGNNKAARESWDTLRAPGRGRYLFGRSLMKYHENRTCEQAGIVNCVCREKNDIHEEFSMIG